MVTEHQVDLGLVGSGITCESAAASVGATQTRTQ